MTAPNGLGVSEHSVCSPPAAMDQCCSACIITTEDETRDVPIREKQHMRKRVFNWQGQGFVYLGLEGKADEPIEQQSQALLARWR